MIVGTWVSEQDFDRLVDLEEAGMFEFTATGREQCDRYTGYSCSIEIEFDADKYNPCELLDE
jgi:hypothetical protein